MKSGDHRGRGLGLQFPDLFRSCSFPKDQFAPPWVQPGVAIFQSFRKLLEF
jgi:hypothetical protein